jgi:DNA topoisomerase-1
MEGKLDSVEDDKLDWIQLLKNFYGPFHDVVDGALEKIEHAGGTASTYKCDKCGSPMVYRISKTGFFLSCTKYPECDGIKSVDEQGKPKLREVSETKCPVCGRDMIKRKGRFGEFLGCSGYSVKNEQGEPSCSVIINLDKEGKPLPPKPKPIKTSIPCEKCGSPMLLRDSKRGPFLGCSTFPKCRSTKMASKLTQEQQAQIEALIPLLKEGAEKSAEMIAKITGGEAAMPRPKANIATDIDCDDCGKPMVIRQGRRGPFLGCSGYPKCKNTGEVPAKLVEEMGLTNGAKPEEKDDKPEAPGLEEDPY